MYDYPAKLRRVVDGDTIDLDIDLGLRHHDYARLRLLGVDTPEIYRVPQDSDEYRAGLRAKQFVEDWFAAHEKVLVRTHKDRTGKFGRWLAEVTNMAQTESLNEMLRNEGWGRVVK